MHMHYQPKIPQDQFAPAWARWKARDNDGIWHWFECRPRWNKKMEKWTASRGDSCLCRTPEAAPPHGFGHMQGRGAA